MPVIWHFYLVRECCHVRPAPKDKSVAIVCKESKFMGFLVNSGVHEFIRKQSESLACQVSIKKADYRFLEHDSFVDCTELYPFDDKDLRINQDVVKSPTRVDIVKAVSQSKTIEPHFKKLII